MLTSAHRLSRNAVIDPTHSALEASPAGLEAESRFFRHYESEDLVLFRLERMRQDFMNAKRCVGWPERFRATLDPSREEYTRHANLFVLLSGMADTKDHSEIVHALQGSALSNSGTPLLQTWKMPSWRKTAELISSPDLGNACWDSCRIRGRQHSGRNAVSVLPKKNTANFTIVLMEQVFVLHGLPTRSFSFRESCLACVRWRMDGKHLHVSHLRISATSAARFQHRMD